ncbi:VWA domain-containing protein [Anabaena sp. FACHB-1237]|uniref:vWA domain-containing protein n=1 Tax=Anabaena sp. FACHB-1237 TaxID=2692769 RepID=UPI001681B2BB|nr:vWA domain-containing protein [Anabaena sp. FACHB-1237]MBD2136051.1 VWA domain-containing protein [Anabaena sp. FACHB-1237]
MEVSPRGTDGDIITLKVKVLNDDNIPIVGLQKSDFKIQTGKITNLSNDDTPINLKYSEIEKFQLIPPGEQLKSDPAYVVILLDMSGSMREKDASGVKKIDGAILAIRGFIKLVREKNLPVHISLVPFGESNKAQYHYEVTQEEIAKHLLPANSPDLDKRVSDLASSSTNAATNLYQPLQEAVEYLGNNVEEFTRQANSSNDLKNDLGKDEEKIPPKLAVILLSDGYHNIDRGTEDQQFAKLEKVFKEHSTVRVYTLGYGESLKHLRDRAINCNIPNRLLDEKQAVDLIQSCKLTNGDIFNYIVDQPRLKQIAELTGGISKFPDNSNEAVNSLETFFKALREYELQYLQPNAAPAEKYQVQVSVNSAKRELNINAEPVQIRMSNFISKLPLIPDRLIILILTLGILGGGLWGFKRWSQHLKEEAERFI